MARRLSVNINDETAAALEHLAAQNEVSITEIVRRAVGVLNYITNELEDGNKSLQIVDERSDVRTKLALMK